MITKKKLRWEVARLHANTSFLEFENDTLKEDNKALLKERHELRESLEKTEAENKALLDTVSMLCEKNRELVAQAKSQRLKIMSLEAMWSAKKRGEDNALSA